MRKGMFVLAACAAVILLAGAYLVGTSAADSVVKPGAALAKSSRIASDPDGNRPVPTGGKPCPADPNPCEHGCSPVNCTETSLGVSGCVQPNGQVFSCQQIGQTVWHRRCPCASQGLFCLPQEGDDATTGTDVLYCR